MCNSRKITERKTFLFYQLQKYLKKNVKEKYFEIIDFEIISKFSSHEKYTHYQIKAGKKSLLYYNFWLLQLMASFFL